MKIDDVEINSEQIREILAKHPAGILKWGTFYILILLFILIGLSWFIKYPEIILSKVVVTTNPPPQKEYAKSSGKISKILITNNYIVRPNQPLAIIENSANYNHVLKLKHILDTLKLHQNNFFFPIDSGYNLSLGEISSEYLVFEEKYIQYDLNKRFNPIHNDQIANNVSLFELKAQLRVLNEQKKENVNEVRIKENDLRRYKQLFEKRVIATSEYENKQLEYSQEVRTLQNFESAISKIKQLISDANKTTNLTDINKKSNEIILLKTVSSSYMRLKKAITDWEFKYVLKSNIYGKVSFYDYWDINQSVKPNDLVFTITPLTNHSYKTTLKAPIQNSGRIKKRQKVNIKLDNFPFEEFGILEGTINNISLTPDDSGMYSVDVSISSSLTTSFNRKIEFKQEMTGVAEIITDDLRLIERLFFQIRKIFVG